MLSTAAIIIPVANSMVPFNIRGSAIATMLIVNTIRATNMAIERYTTASTFMPAFLRFQLRSGNSAIAPQDTGFRGLIKLFIFLDSKKGSFGCFIFNL